MRKPCRGFICLTAVLLFGDAWRAAAQQPVTWINAVNAVVTSNAVQKNSGCDGCGDAGAITQQQITSGTGSVQFAPSGERLLYAGLTHSIASPPVAANLDYAIAVRAGNICDIWELGVYKADCAFVPGDVFKIAIEAGPVVKYYRNGGLIYTSATKPSAYPYALGASLYDYGATVGSALILTSAAPVVPIAYKADSSRRIIKKPRLPKLGAAGDKFRDPAFGSTILRVTDANTRPGSPGRSFTAPSAAHQLAWNATSDRFYIRSIDGTFIPYSFDAKTMTAARIAPSATGDGGLVIRSQVEPQFSFVSRNLIFGSRQDPNNDWPIVQQFDFSTSTYADILNLGTVAPDLAPHTYAGALSSSKTVPERLCILFGGGSQDSHYKVAVLGADGTSPIVLDSRASTITANGVTSLTNVTLNVYLHHAWMDQSGRYVILSTVNQQPVPYYVWDVEAGTVVEVSTNAGGHDAAGYRWQVNQACCTTTTWDAAQWEQRRLSTADSTTDLINPVMTPQEIYLADHTSWNNAQAGTLVPILSSLYRYFNGTGNTTPWRPWDDEIVAVQTDGAGGGTKVWRFAHHRADVSVDGDKSQADYFWYLPMAVISPNGRWAIFNSNWEKTLGLAAGSDSQPGGVYRSDVFLVALQ